MSTFKTNAATSTASQAPPLQFGLKWLFALTAAVAVLAAGIIYFGWSGAIVVGWVYLGVCLVETSSRRSATLKRYLFFSAVLFLLGVFVLSNMGSARTPSLRIHCMNNLMQLGKGLLNYEHDHGEFPAVHTTDVQGQRLTSWRVQITPYIGRTDIFQSYRFNESWNSTANSALSQLKLDLFRCPSDAAAAPNHTSYVAVVGPGTIWQPNRTLSLRDVKDKPDETILLLEWAGCGITWSEPRDLELNNLPPNVSFAQLPKLLSKHSGGFNAVMTDASVRFIPDTISPADFIALLTIDGGEKVDPSKW